MKTIVALISFLPIMLFSQKDKISVSDTIQKDSSIVLYPDVEAKFTGGSSEMMKYFKDNLQYPKIELETVPIGRIFIEFIINIDGSIEQVKVRKEGIKELDKAYIELIKNMPNWTPAEVNGVKVRSRAFLPFRISFQ